MADEGPVMGVGMHAIVTILGALFGLFGLYLAFILFTTPLTWPHLFYTVMTLGIAADFLHGAATRRFPFAVLIWLVPT